MPTSIVDVPLEILLDSLLPVLSLADLLSLTVTSKVANLYAYQKMRT
jgi:hypothetical protein